MAADAKFSVQSEWKYGCAVHADSSEYFASDRYKNIVDGLD